MGNKPEINKITAHNFTLTLIEGGEKRPIFRNACLTAEEGWITYLLGPSGSGKSLMLKSLGGLLDNELECDRELGGDIIWGEEKVAELDKAGMADHVRAKNFGFIFQDLRLVEYLNGKENIELPLRILKRKVGPAMERFGQYINKLGVKEFWHQKVSEMSGGQRQRIAIIRALITDPKVILADEPTTGLDRDLCAVLDAEIFEKEREKGKILVIITHDDRNADISRDFRKSYRLNPDKGQFFAIGDEKSEIGTRRTQEGLKGQCPYCGNSPENWQQRRLKNTNIVIDICPECRGVWLDSYEWEEILSFPRSIMDELEKTIEEIKERKIPPREGLSV